MSRPTWMIAAVLAFGAVRASTAQEKEKDAPPAKADQVTQGFRAYVVSEPRFEAKDIRNPVPGKDKVGRNPVDLVTENGLNPVIAVFSRVIPADGSHPLAAIIKKLDELTGAKEYKARRLGAFVVFLSLQNEFRKDPTFDTRVLEIEKFAAGLGEKEKSRTTLALAEATVTPDGTELVAVPAQVTAMGIDKEDDFVIVFYNKFEVLKRWKFKAATPPGEEDLKALEAEVVKLLGSKK